MYCFECAVASTTVFCNNSMECHSSIMPKFLLRPFVIASVMPITEPGLLS
jgi:hypothetical protein